MTVWGIVHLNKVAWADDQEAFKTLVIYFHKSLVVEDQAEGFLTCLAAADGAKKLLEGLTSGKKWTFPLKKHSVEKT